MKFLLKLIFYYPGRIILWFQYMFPKKGNYFKSHRQYRHGGAIIAFFTSCVFWGVITLLTIGLTSQTDGNTTTESETNISPISSNEPTVAYGRPALPPSRAVIVSEKAHNYDEVSPNLSDSPAKALIVDENLEIERFMTEITASDTVNSRGAAISDPVLILVQDRANVHKFGNPDQDDVDSFFSNPSRRANLRKYLERGSFPVGVQEAIKEGRGILRLRLYKNSNREVCLDVSMRTRDQHEYDPALIIREN